MNICKELKSKEKIAKVFYGPDNVRAVMKKENENDEKEIPKRFDMSSFHHIDKMRKKFNMRNAEFPTKQIYGSDYWIKKKEMLRTVKNKDDKRNEHGKRLLDESGGSSNMEGTKKDKRGSTASEITQNMDSSYEQCEDTDNA